MSLKEYDLLKKIGEGTYGTVYKAKRKKDSKLVVIKQIGMSKSSKQEQREAHNEARILKSLNHRYVVRYFDSFLEAGKLHIVMEYCSGGRLSFDEGTWGP